MRSTRQPPGLLAEWKAVLSALSCGLSVVACHRHAQAPPPPPPEVATVTVVPTRVLLTTELPGLTAPFRTAEITPQVSGLIQKRLFAEGSDVAEGQQLYQIDPAPFQVALDSAVAEFAKSQANLPAVQARSRRSDRLLAERVISQQENDDATSALRQAEADVRYRKSMVETAQINLGYTQITAPIPGRIGRSGVTDGAIVTAYQAVPLATIQQLDPIYVDVPQSTTEILRLRRRFDAGALTGDSANLNRVELILGDGTKYPLEGTLQFRDVSVDPTTASVILRMVFPNPGGILLPGMFVRAAVKEGVNDRAILIPQQAVSRDFKGNPVALIVGTSGKVEQRTLGLERAIGDQWLVSAGIVPGDQLIVEGAQKVRPGAEVNAVPFVEAKKLARAASSAN